MINFAQNPFKGRLTVLLLLFCGTSIAELIYFAAAGAGAGWDSALKSPAGFAASTFFLFLLRFFTSSTGGSSGSGAGAKMDCCGCACAADAAWTGSVSTLLLRLFFGSGGCCAGSNCQGIFSSAW